MESTSVQADFYKETHILHPLLHTVRSVDPNPRTNGEHRAAHRCLVFSMSLLQSAATYGRAEAGEARTLQGSTERRRQLQWPDR